MSVIKVENLSFRIRGAQILNNISFSVGKGEFVGILGPNGSGKSTLLKHILGILPVQSGSISLFSKPIATYNIKQLSHLIGFVPQKSHITLPLLVRDVLLMGRYSALKGLFASYSSTDLLDLEQVAKALNIESFLNRDVLSLSGGEFQRVLLARALLKKPKILCLDEPTSALDVNFALELLGQCEAFIKNEGISVVAVLHDVNLAALFCHRILFLKAGRLRYMGASEELLESSILKEIYGIACEVITHKSKPHIIISKEC